MMALVITTNGEGTVRVITDEFNPRIYLKEIRCTKCRQWNFEEDTVWIPDWKDGKPYCVECAPEQDEEE